jgi:chromate transporter
MEAAARPPPLEPPAPPTLGAIFGVFVRMGMASFGGGLPGWMHREVVVKRGWLDEERFMAGLALGQVLPGPNSVNLALYLGQRLRGWRGAAVAFLGILGPPFLFILVLAAAQAPVADLPLVAAALGGVAAAGLANSCTVGALAARRVRGPGLWGVAAATFIAVGVLRWPMIPVVLALAPVGIGIAWRDGRRASGGA